MQNKTFSRSNYNTTFEYILDNNGLEIAKTGLDNLNISVSYVLLLIPQIEEIVIEPANITYRNI